MSKSLGNFITIQDFLKQHSARMLRFLLLKTLYRSPMDYLEGLLLQTERELQRIDEFVSKLTSTTNDKRSTTEQSRRLLVVSRRSFQNALEDDFNTPKAIAVLFELVNKGNALLAKDRLSQKEAKAVLAFLKEADEIFGFIFFERKKTTIPLDILKLAKDRERYRKEKEWEKADQLRERVEKKGWHIEDTSSGSKLKRL